jgi:hypothetical protein
MEETTGRKFDERRTKIFKNIFRNGENGYFKKLLTEKSCSKNMEKASAWERLTKLYNTVCFISFLSFSIITANRWCSVYLILLFTKKLFLYFSPVLLIRDPVLFVPPRSGIRIRDEFFPDPGSKGYFFGEIFLRILFLFFFNNKTCS